jgi:hypothetical protein
LRFRLPLRRVESFAEALESIFDLTFFFISHKQLLVRCVRVCRLKQKEAYEWMYGICQLVRVETLHVLEVHRRIQDPFERRQSLLDECDSFDP